MSIFSQYSQEVIEKPEMPFLVSNIDFTHKLLIVYFKHHDIHLHLRKPLGLGSASVEDLKQFELIDAGAKVYWPKLHLKYAAEVLGNPFES